VAASCQANLFDDVVPLFVDEMDNHVATLYTGRPTRMYLIDLDGRAIYDPGVGPFGFNPIHLDAKIEEYLTSSDSSENG
jgi:hypothetical protein